MTTGADLAAEIERLTLALNAALSERWMPSALEARWSLSESVRRNIVTILSALRASRPEPAGDAVEAVARWLQEQYGSNEDVHPCDKGKLRPHFLDEARRLLAALPRPGADEGAATRPAGDGDAAEREG
jgi:hypothetical protein